MKLFKMLGLTAIAAVAAMALIGATSASAADNVVLCGKLVSSTELCPAGELLPKGILILAANEGPSPILKGTLNEQCESSHVEGITEAETGPSLLARITSVSFTKNCKPCTTVLMEGLGYTSHLLHVNGKFILDVLNPKARISGCVGGFECVFGAANVSVDVQDNSTVLLIDSLEAPLSLISGSKILCGETGKWIATYKAECKTAGNVTIPCWPALDKQEAEK